MKLNENQCFKHPKRSRVKHIYFALKLSQNWFFKANSIKASKTLKQKLYPQKKQVQQVRNLDYPQVRWKSIKTNFHNEQNSKDLLIGTDISKRYQCRPNLKLPVESQKYFNDKNVLKDITTKIKKKIKEEVPVTITLE